MKQYCRYCANAVDYNGEATDFICTADAPCGNNGAGAFYPAAIAKRVNKCKHFVYNSIDVFYTTYGMRAYKPRTKSPAQTSASNFEQLQITDVNSCVKCNTIIPEGRQVCPNCEYEVIKNDL